MLGAKLYLFIYLLDTAIIITLSLTETNSKHSSRQRGQLNMERGEGDLVSS